MPITERDLFLHAVRSCEQFKKAIRTFDEYLKKKLPPRSQEYYQARSCLRQGQDLFDATLKKAKQLLGPVSPYSPQEVENQRAQLLKENKITVEGLSFNDLREELANDEFIGAMFGTEELDAYLKNHIVSQSTGKRNLANIKMRMVFDKLRTLSVKGQELQIAAQKYFQSG